jgi:DNA uptake protein ComE-like DNA-binding protein
MSTRTSYQHISDRKHGGILVIVLVVLSLVSLSILSFSEITLTENMATNMATRQTQARALTDSGLELLQRFLTQAPELRDEAGGIIDNASRFQGQLVLDGGQARTRGRFCIVAPKVSDGELDGIRYGVEDESTKLNINTLMFAEEQTEGSGRTLLMSLPGMTEETADAILDYLDTDSEQREFGAENEYYSSLEPAYACKNGPLETVDELLLVKGVTPDLLYGADTNRNGMIDASEANNPRISDGGEAPPEADRGWSAYLTLYSVEANLKPDGMPRINLNGDDLEAIHGQVATVMNQQYADFIVAYRQNGPYTGSTAATQNATLTLDFTKQGKTKLTSVLDLIGAKVQIPNGRGTSSTGSSAAQGRSSGQSSGTVIESPFKNDPASMATYLPLLLENTSTNTAYTIPGRININQASSVILAGIPGLDQTKIEAIMTSRELSSIIENPNMKYETWLLSQGIVTLTEMKALMPFVCGQGSAYRAQVIGYFDNEGPAARIEAVIDTSSNQARIVFWRELTHLGRGYSLSQLGTSAE